MKNSEKALRLCAIAALLLAGIMAGAQLGKIAPLVGWYEVEIGFSLVLIGWLTSMIGIFVALAALPAGWAIERAGARKTFFAGSAVMIAGGVALAFLHAPAAILAARLVEGAGYLVLVIAIPALLSSISPAGWKAPVLAIWGGFVPIGYAAADFLAAWLLPVEGPTIFLLAAILAFAGFAVIAAVLLMRIGDHVDERPSETASGNAFRATLTMPVVLVGVAFGIYVILSVGFFTFMPAFIAGPSSSIALSGGTIALLVPIGNVLTSFLVSGRNGRFCAILAALGFGLTALAAIPAFASADPKLATAAAVVLAVAGGVTASALFASIPLIVARAGSVSVAIGLVCQAGGIGTLFGPPLAGHVIESYDWTGFGWFLAAWSLIGIASLLPLFVRTLPAGNK